MSHVHSELIMNMITDVLDKAAPMTDLQIQSQIESRLSDNKEIQLDADTFMVVTFGHNDIARLTKHQKCLVLKFVLDRAGDELLSQKTGSPKH